MNTLEAARNLVQCGKFGEALDLYMDALRSLSSSEKGLLEDEVVTLMETVLNERNDEVFLRLLDAYPKNSKLLFLYATVLLRSGKLHFATAVVQRGLTFHPTNLPLLDVQQRIDFKTIDRWHFRMVNDKLRNQAYFDALAKKIASGFDIVLDIGCGTGILSIFAEKCGAQQIYACESSQVMCSIAKECIDRNKCSQEVRLFCADSSFLKIPDHIPERVRLIVCEIFDGGLLGENCLETLEDAISRLSEVAAFSPIIPAKARFYIMGVATEKLRRSHRAVFEHNAVYSKIGDEPYDLEFLDSNEFESLTKTVKVFEVNFGNLESLKMCKNFSEEIELTCIKDGVLDAVVGWFELDLDCSITLTNSPFKESCWEQAIFPSRKLIEVKNGERLSVSVKVCRPAGAKSHFVTLKLNKRSSDVKCLFSDISVVRNLNDLVLQRYLEGCAFSIRKTAKNLGNLKVLNLRRSFFSLDGEGVQVYSVGDSDVSFGKEVMKVTKDDIIADNLLFDVIVLDLIRESGTLNPEGFQDLEFYRHHLSSTGICIPRRIVVYAMPISSAYLETNSRVIDPVLFSRGDINVGEAINKYKTRHFEEINVDSLQFVSLAAAKKVIILDSEEFLGNKEKTVSFRAAVGGRFSALLYWFETRAFPAVSFNTLNSCSFQKAAFIVDPRHVEVGENINILVRYEPGYLLMETV